MKISLQYSFYWHKEEMSFVHLFIIDLYLEETQVDH